MEGARATLSRNCIGEHSNLTYDIVITHATTCAAIDHYSTLENNSSSGVICWGSGGDFFVIKDVNDFTVNLLPRVFKHSNFTSFVRQLNKYDFRKVRLIQAQLLRHVEDTPRTHEWSLPGAVTS